MAVSGGKPLHIKSCTNILGQYYLALGHLSRPAKCFGQIRCWPESRSTGRRRIKSLFFAALLGSGGLAEVRI